LYFVKALKAGDVITPDSVRSTRPGYGLAPKFRDEVVGKRLRVDVGFATPVAWDILE
jgi:sialic acid synthase SpsE